MEFDPFTEHLLRGISPQRATLVREYGDRYASGLAQLTLPGTTWADKSSAGKKSANRLDSARNNGIKLLNELIGSDMENCSRDFVFDARARGAVSKSARPLAARIDSAVTTRVESAKMAHIDMAIGLVGVHHVIWPVEIITKKPATTIYGNVITGLFKLLPIIQEESAALAGRHGSTQR